MKILLLIVLVSLAVSAVRWWMFWSREGEKLHESGHVPPLSKFCHLMINVLHHPVGWATTGPTDVYGLENLAGEGRIVLVAGNHQDEMDDNRIARVMPFINRRLIAENQLVRLALLKPLFAMAGAVAVKYKQKNGGEGVSNGDVVVETMTNLLKKDKEACLGIFPQGTNRRDNVWLESECRFGTIRAFKRYVRETGDTTARIATVGLHICRHPSQATWFHKLMMAIGFKSFRSFFGPTNYRTIEVIGRPVTYSELPAEVDDDKPVLGNRILFERIGEALTTAQSMDDHLPEWTTSGRPGEKSADNPPKTDGSTTVTKTV